MNKLQTYYATHFIKYYCSHPTQSRILSRQDAINMIDDWLVREGIPISIHGTPRVILNSLKEIKFCFQTTGGIHFPGKKIIPPEGSIAMPRMSHISTRSINLPLGERCSACGIDNGCPSKCSSCAALRWFERKKSKTERVNLFQSGEGINTMFFTPMPAGPTTDETESMDEIYERLSEWMSDYEPSLRDSAEYLEL